MTERKVMRTLFLVIVVLIAVGCATAPATQPNQPVATPGIFPAITRTRVPTPPSDWLAWSRRWLNHTPCSAPCWEDITPNRTTVREALKILQSSPIIASDSVHIVRELCGSWGSPEIASSRRLVWEWTFAGNFESGIINYRQQPAARSTPKCGFDVQAREIVSPDENTLDSPINRIELEFPGATSYAYNIAFRPTLRDVIDAYGQPSHIVAVERPDFSWYFVNIIYQSQGIVLKRVARSPIRLDEKMDFRQAVFSDDALHEGIEQFDDKTLVSWQGIREFDSYCRYENGSPCN